MRLSLTLLGAVAAAAVTGMVVQTVRLGGTRRLLQAELDSQASARRELCKDFVSNLFLARTQLYRGHVRGTDAGNPDLGSPWAIHEVRTMTEYCLPGTADELLESKGESGRLGVAFELVDSVLDLYARDSDYEHLVPRTRAERDAFAEEHGCPRECQPREVHGPESQALPAHPGQ